jgi:HD-GYP domain-containing protein (c-di-GMP phosphodiesterase class II)
VHDPQTPVRKHHSKDNGVQALWSHGGEAGMKEMNVRDLTPGQVLAKPVLGRNGLVMLESGTVLTDRYIKKLKELNIARVYIKDRRDEEERRKTDAAVSAKLGFAESADDRWHFSSGGYRGTTWSDLGPLPDIEKMKENEKSRKNACEEILRLPDSDRLMGHVALSQQEARFRRLFRDVLYDIVNNRDIADELGVLRQTDRFLFQHSMHVTLYSGVVGMTLNYDMDRLYDLTVGALLFDIGMTRLPVRLIKTNRQLTESERSVLRRHTSEGYHVLSQMKGVSIESAKCALFHHERYRGTGYPFGLKWNDIPEYARIVAVADVYDALVSPRHHREAYTPSEAMEYLFASGNYEFGLELVQHFIRHIAVYPVSSVIKLSSGQVGVVAEMPRSLPHRPTVRIIQEADGRRVPMPYEIDLTKQKNLVISSVYSYGEESAKDGDPTNNSPS